MYIKPFGKDLVCSVVCSDLGFVFLFFFFSSLSWFPWEQSAACRQSVGLKATPLDFLGKTFPSKPVTVCCTIHCPLALHFRG